MREKTFAEGGALSPSRIARAALENVGEGLVRLFFRQACAEFLLSFHRHVFFRKNENLEAVRAYCAMSVPEFEAINARQKWANWRTIPRSFLGRLPCASCRAVDLCSGVGHSTQVLAYYLPPGSEILGLEYNPEFVAAASKRDFRDANGDRAATAFRAQSVLETFRDVNGVPLPDAGTDLINSSGALGIHFTAREIEVVADEIFRVLKNGGLAVVDAGVEGVGRAQMISIFESRGFHLLNSVRSCFFDRFWHVCFRKETRSRREESMGQ